MILDMSPTGRGAIARVEFTNDADRDIPYEVQMMRGDISPTGELTLVPADEDFLVFPPQVLIEANSQQVFRVQYLADKPLAKSEIYYLAIRQIPVEFEPGVNQVQVVINYNVLVNVVPPGSSPEPVVRQASYIERAQSTEGLTEDQSPEVVPVEKGVMVDLGNDGTRYFFASDAKWLISGKTASGADLEMRLEGKELSKYTGVGVVGPGKLRQFFFPTEEPVRQDTLKVSVEL
ncbi:fimbria/pilus periplasmic chaperone [Qipengyuania oceanensis]|uniref:Fimbria/pilus periplasmic chaperone n=1 Tax=Qipengyuania oceanensis TaxID=1463597 RepID=A0A844YK76_9SPHN|nr:fimbria/pilus periplasmic chaperone [Qipengyuania oceanensis]MXO63438.1 fimbria/pilus periplasmic chaperone [Qipengyuania oceanensis]